MGEKAFVTRIFSIDNDKEACIELRIFSPAPDGQDFRCKYELFESGVLMQAGHALGVDSLQALLLAIQRVGVDVSVSDYAQQRRLFWNGENDDLGLPLPG